MEKRVNDSDRTLASLLEACALGDRKAFETLYRKTAPRLYGVQLRILGVPALAEEALQETFIQVWRHATEYRSNRGAPLAWLTGIARFRALDIRRGQRASDPLETAEAQRALGESESAAAVFDSLASGETLQRCLERLSAPARQCVILAFCEGYTHDELSRRLGTPIGTVKSWIRRSLQRLKLCIDELS